MRRCATPVASRTSEEITNGTIGTTSHGQHRQNGKNRKDFSHFQIQVGIVDNFTAETRTNDQFEFDQRSKSRYQRHRRSRIQVGCENLPHDLEQATLNVDFCKHSPGNLPMLLIEYHMDRENNDREC